MRQQNCRKMNLCKSYMPPAPMGVGGFCVVEMEGFAWGVKGNWLYFCTNM